MVQPLTFNYAVSEKTFFLSDAPTRAERNEGVGPLHLLLSTLSPLLIVLLLLGQLFFKLIYFYYLISYL